MSLTAIFAHSHRLTIYIVASKEAYLATKLGCNLDDSNLAALTVDCFGLDDSELSYDDGDGGKPLRFVDV